MFLRNKSLCVEPTQIVRNFILNMNMYNKEHNLFYGWTILRNHQKIENRWAMSPTHIWLNFKVYKRGTLYEWMSLVKGQVCFSKRDNVKTFDKDYLIKQFTLHLD